MTVASTSFAIHAGQHLDVPVKVERLDGLAGEVELFVQGLPDGVTAPVVKVPDTGLLDWKLRLHARPDLPLGGGPVRIVARAPAAAPRLERVARVPAASSEAEAVVTATESVWLAVSPAVPFTLTAAPTERIDLVLVRGKLVPTADVLIGTTDGIYTCGP